MPEGHTIHRLARDHRKYFKDDQVRFTSPQGRFCTEAKKINKRPIKDVSAFGKHLFYHFSSKTILHIHLGLYGKFKTQRLPLPDPVGAIRLRGVGKQHGFDLRGPNQCELIDQKNFHALTDRLGPDPLRRDADKNQVWERIHKSKMAIGGLLLNQAILSGVGNVYRADLLFELQIDPFRKGEDISRSEFDALWNLMCRWLALGVKHNRIITVDAKQLGKTPAKLLSHERLLIYKKSVCPDCGMDVTSEKLAARTIYYCSRCQK